MLPREQRLLPFHLFDHGRVGCLDERTQLGEPRAPPVAMHLDDVVYLLRSRLVVWCRTGAGIRLQRTSLVAFMSPFHLSRLWLYHLIDVTLERAGGTEPVTPVAALQPAGAG